MLAFFALVTSLLHATQAHSTGVYRARLSDVASRVLPENASIFSTTKLPSNQNLMATIGNGYVAQQIASDTIYISGVYNGNDAYQSSDVAHRARIPSTNSISLSFPDATDSIAEYYTLDINDALYFNSFIPQSNIFQVEQITYASRVNPNLLITQIFVNNSANPNPLTINLKNNAGKSSADIDFQSITCPSGAPSNASCQVGATLKSEGNYSTVTVGVIHTTIPSSIQTEANTITTYYFASVFLTSLETSANTITTNMVSLYNELYAQREQWLLQHLNAWTDIWQNGRIDIIGDTEQAGNVYASLYYTISSIRDDWHYGLSPGSLSSDGYNGHVFWDQATWMYPPLLMLHERLGFSALQYRYRTLPGARTNANLTGFDQTAIRYPWESAYSGIECCPPSAPEGTRELHINADIPLAIKQYFYATRNLTWLKSIGYPMLEGISNFWVQRSYYNTSSKLYGWLNVQPPDEYHDDVNNSVYTNNGARVTLNFSVEAAKLLNVQYPAAWTQIASNVYLPFDATHQYHPEYDGYTIGTTVKQADVILLTFPWQLEMPETVHRNDLVLYANATSSNGPEMTWSMFAINWLDLGEYVNAMQYFNKSFVSIQKPFKIWTETASGGGTVNFITGAGGYLQSFIFGFGGLRLYDTYLSVNFRYIPWAQMNLIGVDYLYNSIDFNLYNTSSKQSFDVTVVRRDSSVNNVLMIRYSDATSTTLNVNETISVALNKQPIKIMLS